MVKIPQFNDIPTSVRRSPRLRWNYLADFLNELLELEDDEEEEGIPEVTTRDLSISVNDGTDAVAGVVVAIGAINGTTGPAGGCTLKGVGDGEQTITATKEGYEEYSDTITVSENNTSFTISLTEVTPGES